MKWKCKSCDHEIDIKCKNDECDDNSGENHRLKKKGANVECSACKALYEPPEHCGEQMYVAS